MPRLSGGSRVVIQSPVTECENLSLHLYKWFSILFGGRKLGYKIEDLLYDFLIKLLSFFKRKKNSVPE